MSRRYTANPPATFRNREGHELRVASITLADNHHPLSPLGTTGGSFSGPEQTSLGELGEGPTAEGPTASVAGASAGAGAQVESVWQHYADTMKPRRAVLDDGARRIIKDALEVADVDECKAAITGCSLSAFHMGSNDRRKRYNALSQILKGKRGGRTTREQIDLFLEIADKSRSGSVLTSGGAETLREARRSVRDAAEFPNDGLLQQRGREAEECLRQNGWQVVHEAEGTIRFEQTTDETP